MLPPPPARRGVDDSFVDRPTSQRLEPAQHDRVRRKAPAVAREHILTAAELRTVWRAWDQQGWPAGDFQKMLLVTGQCRSEVAGMTWSEIDLEAKFWTIPAAPHEERPPHAVPLSSMAMETIGRLPRFTAHHFLFPTRQRAAKAWAPLSSHGQAKSRCDSLIAASGHEMPAWRWHDLRRTCRSNLSRLRITSDVDEAVIGHVVPGGARCLRPPRLPSRKDRSA
jgi:integrase